MQEQSKERSSLARGLAVAIVLLVLAVSGALAWMMMQASRPAELDAASASAAKVTIRPGQDAPQLPPPTRRMGEIPVVSADRVVLNGLVPEAKRCIGTDAPPGYLTVVLEVDQSGHPSRVAATSFTGATLTSEQSACLAAGLQKLQFARSGTSRLLQRRYFLGGGAPPVEAHLPELVTVDAALAAVQALGSLSTACPAVTAAVRPPAPDGGLRLTFGPEGSLAWQPTTANLDASVSDCLAPLVGRLRLPRVVLASEWRLDLRCSATTCELQPRLERVAELVE